MLVDTLPKFKFNKNMSEMVVEEDEAIKTTSISSKDSLPWVEKYRPNSLDELIAHEEIIRILTRLIDSNNLPHLLFHGPPGTGTFSLQAFILSKIAVCIIFARQNFHHYSMCEANVWRTLLFHVLRTECIR